MSYNFSAPIFISPATRAAYGDPERAELNFVDAAASENILYVVSGSNLEYLRNPSTNHTSRLPSTPP